ncbi:MAG: hypothetical protein CSA24_00785 [Deltaproteobacteria bacterium]|nr:MAG: hypothetical protein CSB49_00945 [Pseudomonadota bacterium]PIE66195.1 MAG: hypothetical protein CSA24_00785 [Deltaproteobacteria bacterium]
MEPTHYHYLTLHRRGVTRSFGIDRPMVIGRSEHVDIHLRDLRVSRLHCRVRPVGSYLRLKDINAANPTVVNGVALNGAPILLQVGDWVRIGPYDLQVEVREEWKGEEPSWGRARQELGRLKRRALARPILVLSLGALVAAAAGVRTWRKKPKFDASVTFLLKERRGVDGRMAPPPPKAQLRRYVFDGIFTRRNSLRLIKKFKLFPSKLALDQNWAIEEMRDHVNVSVYQNQFLIPDNELPERTARIRITYTAPSARLALNVVRELGKMLRSHEERVRKAAAAAAVKLVRHSIKLTARKIDDLAQQRTAQELIVGSKTATVAQKAVAQQKVRQLRALIDRLRDRLAGENTRLARTRVIASREKKSMGIRFELVDWGRMAPPRLKRGFKGAIVAVVVFIFGVPIIGLLIGVLDRRLYRGEDIERLGIVSLGQVPRYPGHQAGSFEERADAEATAGG